MGVGEKPHKAVHVLPDIFPVCVENVRSVLVDSNTLYLLTVDIPSDVGALVDDQALLAMVGGFSCEGGAIQASAYDEIVIVLV